MASTIRLRHPVAHDCLAIACLDRCGGGCSDELTGVIRLWRFEDLTCHSLLDDASSPHDDDPVAQQAHDMQVVTYKQVGHAKSDLEVLQQIQHHGLDRNIHRSRSLLEYAKLGPHPHAPGHAHP